mgnify:FL=1
MYKQIQTLENYNMLLRSGMFWEFHPELTGDWDKDKIIINGVGSLKNLKKENMEELTFGQKAVGLTFNPSGDDNVTKAKQLMAEAIDLLEKDHAEKTDNGNMMSSWTRNVFRTAAFNAIITAQMALVKYLTWKD